MGKSLHIERDLHSCPTYHNNNNLITAIYYEPIPKKTHNTRDHAITSRAGAYHKIDAVKTGVKDYNMLINTIIKIIKENVDNHATQYIITPDLILFGDTSPGMRMFKESVLARSLNISFNHLARDTNKFKITVICPVNPYWAVDYHAPNIEHAVKYPSVTEIARWLFNIIDKKRNNFALAPDIINLCDKSNVGLCCEGACKNPGYIFHSVPQSATALTHSACSSTSKIDPNPNHYRIACLAHKTPSDMDDNERQNKYAPSFMWRHWDKDTYPSIYLASNLEVDFDAEYCVYGNGALLILSYVWHKLYIQNKDSTTKVRPFSQILKECKIKTHANLTECSIPMQQCPLKFKELYANANELPPNLLHASAAARAVKNNCINIAKHITQADKKKCPTCNIMDMAMFCESLPEHICGACIYWKHNIKDKWEQNLHIHVNFNQGPDNPILHAKSVKDIEPGPWAYDEYWGLFPCVTTICVVGMENDSIGV